MTVKLAGWDNVSNCAIREDIEWTLPVPTRGDTIKYRAWELWVNRVEYDVDYNSILIAVERHK